MSLMIRSVVTGGLMAVLALAAMAAPVQAQTSVERQAALGKAARAAIIGPAVKLKVDGHEFIVKKARMNKSLGAVQIDGQISHQLSLRPDDQFYYSIRKQNGKLLAVIFEKGDDRTTISGDFLSRTYTEGGIGRALSLYRQRLDGSWESAAKLIVLSIALRAPSSLTDFVPYQPKSGN